MQAKLAKLKEIEEHRNLHNTVEKGTIVYLIEELKRMYRLQEVIRRYVNNDNS
jgi:hypothetical protein